MNAFYQHYCHLSQSLGDFHVAYHNHEYGFPVNDDNELFKRLMLEVNQAGLSWTIILNKRKGLVEAYDNFDVQTVSNYTEKDIKRLLNDTRIIRNKLKVHAAIYNANMIIKLQKTNGSFKNWLQKESPKSQESWVKLFKNTFKFTGSEITNEFLKGTGFIKGAHHNDCSVYKEILTKKPFWTTID